MSVAVSPHRGAATTRALVGAVQAPMVDVLVVLDDASGAVAAVEALGAEDLLVLSSDVPEVAALAHATAARVTTVGLSAADVSAASVRTSLGGTDFDAVLEHERYPVHLELVGERFVPAALAAIVVAVEAQQPLVDALAAISSVGTTEHDDFAVRTLDSGLVVIDDGYDTGFRSTVEALKTLVEIAGESRRSVAVLGELDMDPGDPIDWRDEHDRLGRIVVRLNIGQLVVVGDRARHLASAAGLEGSWDGQSRLVADLDGAYDLLRAELRERDLVLVKTAGGSHLADRLGTVRIGGPRQ